MALIKSLIANGVKVPADESICLGGEKASPTYNLDAIILDFSEHDKVFEDKIAELKKDYRTVSELLGKYQQENESLKKRIIELEDFSCQAEQETESLVEKLNQRIVKLEKSRSEWIDKAVEWQQKCEKLESKETEKPTKCTTVIVAKEINGQTYVTLDDFMSVVNDFQAEIGT